MKKSTNRGLMLAFVIIFSGILVACSDTSSNSTSTSKLGKLLFTLGGDLGEVNEVSWSPDGSLVALSGNKNKCTVWDATTGKELYSYSGNNASVGEVHVAWSPNGKMLAASTSQHSGVFATIDILNPLTGNVIMQLGEGVTGGSPHAMRWSPDSKVLATSEYSTINIWNMANGTLITSLECGVSPIDNIVWAANGYTMMSLTWENAILWRPVLGEKLFTFTGHTQGLTGGDLSADGARIFTVSWDATGIIWDASTGLKTSTMTGHTSKIYDVAVSPDGQRIATVSGDKRGIIWDAATSAKLLVLNGHSSFAQSASWCSDSRRVATGTWQTAYVWDVVDQKKLERSRKKQDFRISIWNKY